MTESKQKEKEEKDTKESLSEEDEIILNENFQELV